LATSARTGATRRGTSQLDVIAAQELARALVEEALHAHEMGLVVEPGFVRDRSQSLGALK
jgi:hypothetical protein